MTMGLFGNQYQNHHHNLYDKVNSLNLVLLSIINIRGNYPLFG